MVSDKSLQSKAAVEEQVRDTAQWRAIHTYMNRLFNTAENNRREISYLRRELELTKVTKEELQTEYIVCRLHVHENGSI
jgi:hypothetical protein